MTRSTTGARRFDIIVVGSGIGGLVAALTAARRGLRVLVLEAGKQLGGYTNPFQRRHYDFDPGLHYIGECGPGQAFARMIEDLGLDGDVRFRELSPDGFDRLRFPGYEVATPRGADRYRDRLARDFPRERRGLDRFFAILREFGDAVRALDRVRGARTALALAPRLPVLVRWLRASFADVLDAAVRDPLLRAVLSAQGGDYGLPPSKASALVGLGVLDHYLRGAYFPVGGSRALRDAFVAGIKRHGGELLRNHAVERILLSGGRVAGARCKGGEEYQARAVISNVDATVTYRDLLGGAAVPWLLRRKVERTSHSFGSLCLFLGTDLDLAAAGMTDANVWSYPSVDIERAYAPLFAGQLAHEGFFFLSSPTLKDPGAPDRAPPGHHTLELVTLAPFAPFARWAGTKSMKRGAEYERFKAELGDRYVRSIEQLVPGIRDRITVMEVATPVTNITYAGSPRGAIYGPAHTPGQMGPFRFAPRSPVEGLYLCGSSVLSAGIVPSALSGFKAGRMAAAALGAARTAP
ncbi:MAG: NAD(P)/FAD-dependent oxidoreductase [Polyangiaceae bacterium]|nr:NAD(P)/FAD-dependent oxidoreductase [Polyangiaceae bacterium]